MTSRPQPSAFVLGKARLDRYLSDCGNDPERAERLFDWNLRMADATHEALHLFEITLRNAIDRELRAWNEAQGFGTDWLLTPDPRLQRLLIPDALRSGRARARIIAANHQRASLHDDVLAQMTLGTWRYLLPSNSSVAKQRLWESALYRSFPEWPGAWQPLVSRVEVVHELRNRVAHLEPLHRSELRSARQAMRAVATSVGRQAGALFKAHERMLPIIDELEGVMSR